MASPTAILAIVAEEPALVRWLHSHDPDRDMSVALLKSSATYISNVPQPDFSAVSDFPQPPTASLIVPMYARKNFVLGQLYGQISPNATALNGLSSDAFAPPPQPICRRFVVDLSYPDALAFLEYEWLADGTLCVSMHNVTLDGHYTGESILLASPTRKETDPLMEKEDLLGKNRAEHPTKVVMKVRIDELSGCVLCDSKGISECSCPTSAPLAPKEPKSFDRPTNWETWIAAFTHSRTGLASLKVKFTVVSPYGTHGGSVHVNLEQNCELGVEPSSKHGSQLLKMFFDSLDMLLSHPSTDDAVRAAEGKSERIEIAAVHSEDEDWTTPDADVAEKVELAPHTSEDGNSSSEEPVGASTGNDSDPDALVQVSSASSLESRPQNVQLPMKGGQDRPFIAEVKQESPLEDAISVGRASEGTHEPRRQIQKNPSTTRRRGRQRQSLFTCECGKIFHHKGHYNEHRLCVHEKVRDHYCEFPNCQSRFFKRSDRDRHMRSKHDASFGT